MPAVPIVSSHGSFMRDLASGMAASKCQVAFLLFSGFYFCFLVFFQDSSLLGTKWPNSYRSQFHAGAFSRQRLFLPPWSYAHPGGIRPGKGLQRGGGTMEA